MNGEQREMFLLNELVESLELVKSIVPPNGFLHALGLATESIVLEYLWETKNAFNGSVSPPRVGLVNSPEPDLRFISNLPSRLR